MKHVTSMSKARPKQALDLGGLGDIKGMLGSMADSIFKTPDEKGTKESPLNKDA